MLVNGQLNATAGWELYQVVPVAFPALCAREYDRFATESMCIAFVTRLFLLTRERRNPQSSVQIEVKDVSQDEGWQMALEHNRNAGGTLCLPIFMQGDRIYWGQVLWDYTALEARRAQCHHKSEPICCF